MNGPKQKKTKTMGQDLAFDLGNYLTYATSTYAELTVCSDPWMKEKNNQECKNNENHTFTMKISMKIVFIFVNDNNSSTVVNGADILGFHFLKH